MKWSTITCELYIARLTSSLLHVPLWKPLIHTYTSVFLISLYGAPLAHRASYLALHSSLFGPVAHLIIIILSLTALTLC